MNHGYWKKFHIKSDEKQKICFCTPVSTFQKISTLNICDGAKQIYPKKQKQILTNATVRISEVVDSNLSKPVKIMTSELLFLTLLLFFCRSINKNVLEWFLLIISKEHNLTRSASLLSRNHPSCFWLRKDTQYLLLTLWLEVQK